MSVLAEETSLVAKRDDLDECFPDGADAFVAAAMGLARPPRFVSDDDEHLVSLSFHDGTHAREAIALIEELDVNWVLIEPASGVIPEVSWIKHATYAPGVARVWLAGRNPGKLALPDGWSPATSHESDVYTPEDTQRMLRVAEEDGVETFLDLETGAEVRAEHPAPEAPTATPIHDALIEALAAIGWTATCTAAPAAHVDLTGKTAIYTSRYWANEDNEILMCITRGPLRVPLSARRRAMDFITRVNFRTCLGNFDLSLDDGRLSFRSAVDIEGSLLTQQVVRNLASNNVFMFDRYYPFLMEVVYGPRMPKAAFEAAESA